MSEGRSSSELRSLIEAAQADGPSSTARAKVWGMLAHTIGAGGAAGAPASSGLGGLSAAKALIAGTLLGGAVSVGLATAALTLRPLPAVDPSSTFEPGAAVPALASEPLAATVLRVAAIGPAISASARATENAFAPESASPGATDHLAPGAGAPSAPASATSNGTFGAGPEGATSATRAHPRMSSHGNAGAVVQAAPGAPSRGLATAPDDALGREAWLLADARAALARGDAASALRSVHATLGVPNRQLVPEELALEAKTLRALGRIDEAAAVESRLRTGFPESALVR